MTQHPTPASPPVDDRAEDLIAMLRVMYPNVDDDAIQFHARHYLTRQEVRILAHLRAEKAAARKAGYSEGAAAERQHDLAVEAAALERASHRLDDDHGMSVAANYVLQMISPTSRTALAEAIAAARQEERLGIIAGIRHEAEAGCPCAEDRTVVAGLADLVEAGFSYRGVDRMEAEREAEVAAAEEMGRKAAMEEIKALRKLLDGFIAADEGGPPAQHAALVAASEYLDQPAQGERAS